MSKKLHSDYQGRQGISEESLSRIQVLHRQLRGPFSASDAAAVIEELDLEATRRLLAYLAERGWLTRVRQGLYVAPPLGASDPNAWLEDPWAVAERTFAPCYVGGWSACEHWGLTDQLFREVLVVTAKRVRERRQEIQGIPYRLTVRSEDKLFGIRTVWRSQVPVSISDPSRTLVDILDDPGLGGGLRHVADVTGTYFSEDHRSDAALVDYATRCGNRTVFKRLGFLVEWLGVDAEGLVTHCLEHRSSGVTQLDPTAPAGGPVDRRWDLEINVTLPLVVGS